MFTAYFPELHKTATDVLRKNREYFGRRWSERHLAEYQLAGLKKTLTVVKRHSNFYKRHFAEFDASFIENLTFESFERLPFTTKDDLRREMLNMVSKPIDECCFFYETTGTTGPATPCPRDYVDTIYNNIAVTSCLETILKVSRKKHFVGICGPTELHSFGDTLGDVCKNMGLGMAKFWAYSPVIGLKKSVDTLRELGITVLMCTPGMALTMAKVASQNGYDLKEDFKLEVIMLTGELASPAMIGNIGHIFGAKAYNFLYGAQEALVLATATSSRRMHTFPLNFFYEVIDPTTGKRVESEGGIRSGELVISMLFQGSKPMLRYRTGDFVRLHEALPGDVFPSPAIEVLGRTRDALVLNGQRVQGYDIEQTLLQTLQGVLGYQISITNDGADALDAKVEMLDRRAHISEAQAITDAFRTSLGIRAKVTFGDIGSIGSTGALVSWKAARIIDERVGCTEESARLEAERRAAQHIAAHRDQLLKAAIAR